MITILTDKIMMHITDTLFSRINNQMFLNTACCFSMYIQKCTNIWGIVSNTQHRGYPLCPCCLSKLMPSWRYSTLHVLRKHLCKHDILNHHDGPFWPLAHSIHFGDNGLSVPRCLELGGGGRACHAYVTLT